MPNLRVLDFQKVKLKEKIIAKQLFESEKGKQLLEDLQSNKFKEEGDEYSLALERTLQDEEKKKKLLVKFYL
jgi:hypothetical protein